ncbi:MAG TPA: glucose 1-dehydrogenase [Candidatus Saccharimonadales bacterium]|nr:glucose 1-dehydrogenase [Candidatus Saccharimonadales bacterium]
MRLEGKKALVTGSSGGIGEAVAIRLAEEGADVVVNYRSNPEGAKRTVEAIQALGRRSVAVQADLSRVQDVQRLVAESIKAMGQLDILVNNAGVEKNCAFLEVTEQDYDLVLDVNLKGVFFTTQGFARHLKESKRPGKVINMSSVHEDLPFPNFTPYCASKGGLKMMTRNLAIELAPYGITVNSIAPGAIETPINSKLLNDPAKLKALLEQIPLKRLGKTTDVAGVAAFLASSDADYMTGSSVFVDGGLTWDYEEQ